jgi:hypothetical protein
MYFDGAADYLQIADSGDWTTGATDFTWEAWIYPTYINQHGGIIHQGEGGPDSSGNDAMNTLNIYSSGTGNIRWLIRSIANSTILDLTSPASSIAINNWYHVAAVRHQDVAYIYINGVYQNSTPMAATLEDYPHDMYIGTRKVEPSTHYYYYGYMQDVRISHGIARYKTKTANFTPPGFFNKNSLVLCLDAMNAKSFAGEPAVNLKGNEDFSTMSTYTGLDLVRAVESESPSGYACQMTLNSSHSNASARSRWGAAGSIPTSGSAFVSVWVKGNMKTAVLGLKPDVFCGNSWHTLLPLDGGSVYITPGKYRRFGLYCTMGTNSTGPNPGFSMVRGTGYNSSAGAGATTWWIKPMVTTKSHAAPFTSGTRAVANSWKDLSGNGNHGTHSAEDFGDSGDYELRRVGQILLPNTSDITSAPASINFDGSNDCVAITGIDPTKFSHVTVSTWTNIDSKTTWGTIAMQADSNAFNEGWGLNFYGAEDNLQFWVESYSKSSTAYFDVSPYYGQWVHIVGTYDGVNERIYLNGNEKARTARTWSNKGVSTNEVHVGAAFSVNNTSVDYELNGKISTLQIYSAALTHAQIKQIYNAQRSRFGL